MQRLATGLAIALAAIPCALAQDAAAPAPVSLVHCGHLFDSGSGRLLGETSIVVRGERIESVQAGHSALPASPSATPSTRSG